MVGYKFRHVMKIISNQLKIRSKIMCIKNIHENIIGVGNMILYVKIKRDPLQLIYSNMNIIQPIRNAVNH